MAHGSIRAANVEALLKRSKELSSGVFTWEVLTQP